LFQPHQMSQQQQKVFISTLSSALESTHSMTSITPTSSLNTSVSSMSIVATTNSQLLQQLQQPLDMKPQTSVNNTISTVNKNTIPNTPIMPSKVEQPEPSPTGNNNKSNINLNHLTLPPTMSVSNPTNQINSTHQHHLQQLQNSNQMNSANTSMQATQNTSTSSTIQQQLTNPNQVKHQPSFGINTFVDPLEHSLASLEQPQMNNNSQKNSSQDMAMLLDFHKQKQMLLQQMAAPHTVAPNGFTPDFSGGNGVNNLMNMLLPQIDPSGLPFLSTQMMNAPGRYPENSWTNLPANNQMIHTLAAQQQQLATSQHSSASHSSQQQLLHTPSTKHEKIMLTPKPIEELLMNPNEKVKTPGSQNPAFGQAYSKNEQNLKNASSWSQIADSPQSSGPTLPSKSKVPSDTFQEYRTKLKEQQQRQKQEQEKMKKQKEQELKRQQESLQKHKTTSEDLSNGHR
jgi:bromodomain-containing protein 4